LISKQIKLELRLLGYSIRTYILNINPKSLTFKNRLVGCIGRERYYNL